MNAAYIYAEQIEPVFVRLTDYNLAMLNKADIDGNLTTGGIWWQDQVLSDRFANYKQVWTALTNNTIEWGNVELDKHIFLVDDINGLKVKVGGTEGTIWNTLNLTNVSQLNNDAGYLQANDLDGFIYDVQYNSSSHTITFYQQNEPNIVIDLPIEQLIKGVQLVGNDLVFTFEDGSTVTVPLNTLLVGVVKSVNGKTPNSQGEIVLQITDIPNLSSELSNKLDIRMAGLVSNLTQPEKDAILSKLGVVNNIVQVLGLSGNTITLSNGGGSISLNIVNIGGLKHALGLKANVNGNNLTNISDWRTNLGVYSTTQVDGLLAGKANTSGYYSGLSVGNSDGWNGQSYSQGNVNTPNLFMTYNGLGWGHTSIPQVQSALGITTALGLNFQQVTNNGNSTTNTVDLRGGANITNLFFKDNSQNLGVYLASLSNGNLFIGRHSNYDWTADLGSINYNGTFQWNGTISTASHGTSADWWNATQAVNKKEDAYVHSHRDFQNGTLIETDINYPVINGEEFELELKGNTYLDSMPLFARVQGYVYNNTIISQGGFTSYEGLNNISVMGINGKLFFWFPRLNYWQGFSAKVNAINNKAKQRVISISDSPDPMGSQRVDIGLHVIAYRDWVNNNFASNTALGNYALLSQVYTQSQALALFVGLNGVQTIADTKTFTNSPIVPNATLSSHAVNKSQLDAVSASIPTVGNGQLSFTAPTGLAISGTFNANQSGNTTIPITWQAGYQGFTTAESNKLAGIQAGATVPNNGTFTVQGDGVDIIGSGSTSADASANSSSTFSLSTATKNDITQGKNASTQVNNLFGSITKYYKIFNMTAGGFVDANEQVITQIFTTSGNPTINISDHTLDGADLKIYGASGGVTTVNINAVNYVGASLTTFNLEGNGRSFHWSDDFNAWVEYFN